MRTVAVLCVLLLLSVPSEATVRAVYDLLTNPIFGTVDVATKLLENVLRVFRGFPLIGFAADEGAAAINFTGSLAMNILQGSNRMLLPLVNGVDVVVEIPFQTKLLTPLRWLLEDTIDLIGLSENKSHVALEHMVNCFDGSFNETQGIIVGLSEDNPDIVSVDETVLEFIRVLNATVYSTMQTILVPLTTGGSRHVSQRGDELWVAASENLTVAIVSLNGIQFGLPEASNSAINASSVLITEMDNLRSLLDANWDLGGVASSIAAVIYKSVQVLVEFSAVGVSKDDLSEFFVKIIGAVARAVNGGILKLASGGAVSQSSISTFINTALAPLGITVTVTLEEVFSSQEEQ